MDQTPCAWLFSRGDAVDLAPLQRLARPRSRQESALNLPHIELAFTLSGLAVGFLVGLTGVGGGSLMTPLLVLLFGISPTTAVGTDLLYAAATKTVGTGVHGL